MPDHAPGSELGQAAPDCITHGPTKDRIAWPGIDK